MQKQASKIPSILAPSVDHTPEWQEAVRKEWTHPAVAYGYRKWSAAEIEWAREATGLLADRATVEPAMHVLDVASGHGEPSIEVARRGGPHGRVVATDQALDILCLALKRALQENLNQYEIEVADAHRLPFAAETFDRVTCRLGLMFFARPVEALREARRVLKPHGSAAFLVWGPADQPFFNAVLGPFARRAAGPQPEPGAPGPFRFGQPGTVKAAMEAADFSSVAEDRISTTLRFHGSPAEYWEFLNDTAPPLQTLIARVPERLRDDAIQEVLQALARRFDGHDVTFPATVNVAVGGR